VRAPGPFRQGRVEGIYGLQAAGKQRFFGSYTERAAQAT
jgi:hypothetical protein